ncbi:hypothetical protein ACH50O_04985 [Methylomonas sp. 2BW1-5-20]|uniref:hypothetical protein n=1 Tax=Methylomonas sp. 2BW1-5-20 TaxID=3376686 RepID=UPI004052A6AF
MSKKLDWEKHNKQINVDKKGATPLVTDISPTGSRADQLRFEIPKSEIKERAETFRTKLQNQLSELNGSVDKNTIYKNIIRILSSWYAMDASSLNDPTAKIAKDKLLKSGLKYEFKKIRSKKTKCR